ncbi:hypothetical protein EGT65_07105 [Burkholderia mallei]|nr:hypothetical protein EGT65_07105 [Burkholderia mallei]
MRRGGALMRGRRTLDAPRPPAPPAPFLAPPHARASPRRIQPAAANVAKMSCSPHVCIAARP